MANRAECLNADDFCIMLNRLSELDYLALNLCRDACLDNPAWSGNNTTLIAIDCRLPIVTLPTNLMRERHTVGNLSFIHAEEMICTTDTEYIQKASKLVNDQEYYQTMKQLITKQRENLYNDVSVIKSLEEFYESAHNKNRQ